ncbi:MULTISPECIES: helix-turn-helix transcriptional regulator [unclassified Devosia]|uniref:helix-turn-helix domain-containing protein n=1 Tax=unclassified Devosia TaxID=196773 RepID=UPI00155239E2|nr:MULTISPECIES: helix-turn-helix transcriptional regulator [unclassified Devosia]
MYGNPQKGQSADDVAKLRQEAGLWLKTLREDAGLSQRDLSRHLDLDYYTFISQIESGKGRVPPNQYAAMAKALKVEPHDFAKQMLRFYDPITHEMLFGGEPKQFSPIVVRKNDPKVSQLAKRLAKLERLVSVKTEPQS